MPEISLIIPTRNRNTYLKKCLTSLKNQSFKDFEVLVCDDGGKKKADKVVSSFKKVFDIKYIWNKDRGCINPGLVRNIGWKNSNGKYILFLDCDIILPANAIEMLYLWLTKYGNRKYSFHVTPSARIHIKSDIPLKIIKNNLTGIEKYIENNKNNTILQGTPSISTMGLFYKNIITKIGGFDDILFNGHMYEDIEMGARLYAFLKNKRKFLPLKIYHLNHYSEFTQRELVPRSKIFLSKAIIKKKYSLLGFNVDTKYRPKYNLGKFSKKYYDNLLLNKERLNKISRTVYNLAKNGKINY